MNRDLLSTLNWKKNIRVRMFLAAFLSFVIAVALSSVLDHAVKIVTGPVGTLLVLFILFLVFFFFFTRPIARYLRTLADGLMYIAKGNLDYRVPLSTQDELGFVAQNINFMAEQLQIMMNRERQIEMSKMELITNVSHDLRTPLTSIIGYLNLLKNDDYKDLDEHKRYINNAYNKTQQLKKLIDDLFEYTRLTSGNVSFSFETIDLSGLLEQIIIEFEPIAQEHELTIRKIWEQKPVFAPVDAEKLVRAIDNLLMNALKFSNKPGEITVRLYEEEQKVVLAVENSGVPVTKEQEQLLFERLYKVEPSRNVKDMPSGAGLGLSIGNYIVGSHGGRMGLNHQDGYFSFFIELPKAGAGGIRSDRAAEK